MTEEFLVTSSKNELSWICPGMGDKTFLVERPEWFWTTDTGCICDAWVVAEDFTHIQDQSIARLNELTQNSFSEDDGHRQVVVFNCGMIYAPEVKVGNRNFHIDDKMVSIDFNRLRLAREMKDDFAAEIYASREATRDADLVVTDKDTAGLPICIQARDIHFFFHFMTETLPQFVSIQESGATGPITICDLNEPPKYVMGFIETLFPDLAGRVTISGRRHVVNDVLLVDDFEDLIRAHGALDIPPLPHGVKLHRQDPNGLSGLSAMFSNSHSINLKRIAEIGREVAKTVDTSKLPKRLFISRRKAATRGLVNEDLLLKKLEKLGVEPFIAEDYSPAEQIAAFAGAELVIGPHGAGMTNIMFASPDCHAIELTQRQYTGRSRHFIRLADIAKCSYEIILCDESGDQIKMVANRGNDVALTDRAVDQIAAHVENVLNNGFTPVWRLAGSRERSMTSEAHDTAREDSRLRFFGMPYSGVQTVANWAARNTASDSVFLNACNPRKSPFETFNHIEINGEPVPKPKLVSSGVDGLIGDIPGSYTLLMSYESYVPDDLALEQMSQPTFNYEDINQNILVYRSYLNWLASYLELVRFRQERKQRGDKLAEEFSMMARAVATYCENVGVLLTETAEKLVPVSYDRWCTEAAYRSEVAGRLGLELVDDTLGAIQVSGGGSSFDDAGDASAEPERFTKLEGDLTFDALARLQEHDPVLVALKDKGFI